ncbi:hypothetical protein [Herbiconiux sp. L3-i23]|uniref:hypothetical protein n=1 Tax=Herbiconiux sp. L3-i23 TaxID=2905871 RepID=UPI0020458826|nr:hypothetical protein [Herbiconiux sp. L3-i23]BDI21885.1 hypothetical protein L3i23_06610 [Herbiconiux sp. L3-i23]
MTATALGTRVASAVWPSAALLVVSAAAILAVGARSLGAEHYSTDPIGVLAAAGAAALVILAVPRMPSRAVPVTIALAVLLGVHAVAGPLAVVLAASGVRASALETWWSALWLPIFSLGQLAAVIALLRPPRWLGATLIVVAAAAFAVSASSAPAGSFDRVATTTGDGSASLALEVSVDVWMLSLLVLPAVTVARILRADDDARRPLLAVALVSVLPLLGIAGCLALAIARDPGRVDPSVGSVAFLVLLGATSAGVVLSAPLAAPTASGGTAGSAP